MLWRKRGNTWARPIEMDTDKNIWHSQVHVPMLLLGIVWWARGHASKVITYLHPSARVWPRINLFTLHTNEQSRRPTIHPCFWTRTICFLIRKGANQALLFFFKTRVREKMKKFSHEKYLPRGNFSTSFWKVVLRALPSSWVVISLGKIWSFWSLEASPTLISRSFVHNVLTHGVISFQSPEENAVFFVVSVITQVSSCSLTREQPESAFLTDRPWFRHGALDFWRKKKNSLYNV